MRYFKITYMLSGKYKSIYIARIISWENERIKIIDQDGREYLLKEEYIVQLKKYSTAIDKKTSKTNDTEQQALF